MLVDNSAVFVKDTEGCHLLFIHALSTKEPAYKYRASRAKGSAGKPLSRGSRARFSPVAKALSAHLPTKEQMRTV